MAEELGFEFLLAQPYAQAIESVTAALKSQGFGILTRIDVQATMKEKLGVDFRPYTILGACNPPLAHKALCIAPEVGLLLPCNVTVEENGPGQSLIRIANPAMMAQAIHQPNAEMQEVAAAAADKIQKVIASLQVPVQP
jgi:uncharacterized protein (DUF302 family)